MHAPTLRGYTLAAPRVDLVWRAVFCSEFRRLPYDDGDDIYLPPNRSGATDCLVLVVPGLRLLRVDPFLTTGILGCIAQNAVWRSC